MVWGSAPKHVACSVGLRALYQPLPWYHLCSQHTIDPFICLHLQWERFQANGCPDWWLLAKYVSQAARSFPYVPRGLSAIPGSIALDTQDSRRAAASDPGMGALAPAGIELQHKHSKDPAQPGQPSQPSPVAAADKQAAVTVQAVSQDAAESSPRSPAAVPDALPTSSHGLMNAGHAGAAAPAACGLQGIFGCSGGCTPPCSAPPADQIV
jgi:hypothetical protein